MLGLVRLVCSDSTRTRFQAASRLASIEQKASNSAAESDDEAIDGATVVPRADIFNLFFVVEMLAKLYGLGCIGYWGDG